jgi:hypothetical protein
MQLGHVFTLANRLMKKPLLTAANVALSFGVLLGSAPAVAETVFVEGVWNGNRLEFYDSRLNSSSYFASLSFDDWNGGNTFVYFRSNLPAPNPILFNQIPEWKEYRYFVNGFVAEGIYDYSKSYYLWEHSQGIVSDSVRIEERHIRCFNSFPCNNNSYSVDGYVYESNDIYSYDPTFVETELLNSFSKFPYSGDGVFDFEQSFIQYSDGSSQSIADSLRQGITRALNFDYEDFFGTYIFNL